MKRFALTLLIGLAFVAFGTAVAHAQAVVIRDNACTVLAGDCRTFEVTTESIKVQASNTPPNSMISCKLDLPAGAPLPPGPGAAHCDFSNTGLLCNTGFGTTDDWKEVVSPSGQVSLVCHINGQP